MDYGWRVLPEWTPTGSSHNSVLPFHIPAPGEDLKKNQKSGFRIKILDWDAKKIRPAIWMSKPTEGRTQYFFSHEKKNCVNLVRHSRPLWTTQERSTSVLIRNRNYILIFLVRMSLKIKISVSQPLFGLFAAPLLSIVVDTWRHT